MATRAAYSEFFRVLSDPAGAARQSAHAPLVAHYHRRWARYTNNIFEDRVFWSSFLARHGLYRYTRPIFNPARTLGDFYAAVIYPGVLATDGKQLPDGVQQAIPLADDIDPKLRDAIAQLWQWSNWQDGMGVMTLFGAVLGDVGVEVVDEVDRGKVTLDVIWPGWVTDLVLDGTGNVKAYALEYDVEEGDGKKYTYRKEVDSEWIVEYKDGSPFPYDPGIDAVRPNPYGFAPFVWCRHQNIGTNYGAPSLRNEQNVDELNSLASHAYDRSHDILSSPVVVSGSQSASLERRAAEAGKQPGAAAPTAPSNAGRESIRFITAGEGAGIASIELPEGEVAARIDRLWANIENEHPELTMYMQLRSMSQVTGPGAEILIGDAGNLIYKARAGYDTQSVKLFQMAVAMAGWRAQSGAWGRTLTRQQESFRGFDLESYAKGNLDFEIMPRPLMPRLGKSTDEKRLAMEAGERGYASWQWVSNQVTGDAAAQQQQIAAEEAAQPQPVTPPQTVDELAAALARNGGQATSNSADSAPENIESTEGLNGIQIRAAVELLEKVTMGAVAPAIATELLVSLGIERTRVERMVAEAGRFVARRETQEQQPT